MPSPDYDVTYVAWSNAQRTATYQAYSLKLVPWLQSTGAQYITLTGVRANQDTFVEIAFQDLQTDGTYMLFGCRSGSANMYELHIY